MKPVLMSCRWEPRRPWKRLEYILSSVKRCKQCSAYIVFVVVDLKGCTCKSVDKTLGSHICTLSCKLTAVHLDFCCHAVKVRVHPCSLGGSTLRQHSAVPIKSHKCVMAAGTCHGHCRAFTPKQELGQPAC